MPLQVQIRIIWWNIQLFMIKIRPIGKALGIQDRKKRSPKPNPTLEAAFQCGLRPVDYKALVTDTGMSDRQINVWMRMRNLAGK